MKRYGIVAANARVCWQLTLVLALGLVGARGIYARASEDTPADARPATTAQENRYQPGDKIWYQKSKYPLVWEVGEFLYAAADGKRAIYRQKPNDFYKDGFESGAFWKDIRPFIERPVTQEETDANTALAATNNGVGMMTQADILDFLKTRLGVKAPINPQTDQIKKELALMIKRRGLAFRDELRSDFRIQCRQYGWSSELSFCLQDNYGPATTQSWLMGAWKLSKRSTAVDSKKPDGIYRDPEFAVKGIGTLTLNPNGTYVWNYYTDIIRGSWRKATASEMQHQGGDAVVLLKAKATWDWLVLQNRDPKREGNWIVVKELSNKMVEAGSRP